MNDDKPINPFEPTNVQETLALNERHQFKWSSVATSVSVLVATEGAFIFSMRIWLPLLHVFMTWIPMAMTALMSIFGLIILRAFKSMTEMSLGLLAPAIAAFCLHQYWNYGCTEKRVVRAETLHLDRTEDNSNSLGAADRTKKKFLQKKFVVDR